MLTSNQYICSFGEILWDDFPSGRLPGGAPMNVAIGLQNLGVPTAMISRTGDDALGAEIKAFLQSKNCSTQWVQTDTEHETGIVKVQASASGENHYTIVQPVAWDFIGFTPEIADLVKNAHTLIFGTLACRNEVSCNTLLELLQYAQFKVFDVNFRAPFFDQKMVKILMEQADMVKMNDEELKIISSWYNLSDLDEMAQMHFLKEHFNLQTVVVTRGAHGAACLDKSGFYQSPGFKVQVNSTVGSGDAFLAGFLQQRFQGIAPAQALTYACALGALVATHQGANPIIEERDIQQIIQQQTVLDLPINHLQHIGIPVTDLAVSEAFYQRLGFQNVMASTFEIEGEKGGKVTMMKRGTIIVELYQMPPTELLKIRERQNGHIDHIAFDVNDIDATYTVLKNAGLTPLEQQPVFLNFWNKGCKYFNILGPDGERLEFNQIIE